MKAAQFLPTRSAAWRWVMWSLAALLLLVPAVVMQFTSEMNWGSEDFLAAALMIGGAGLAIELAVRLVRTPAARYAAVAVILLAVLLIWAELAVGLFH